MAVNYYFEVQYMFRCKDTSIVTSTQGAITKNHY